VLISIVLAPSVAAKKNPAPVLFISIVHRLYTFKLNARAVISRQILMFTAGTGPFFRKNAVSVRISADGACPQIHEGNYGRKAQ
jgi:hypothetical protein